MSERETLLTTYCVEVTCATRDVAQAMALVIQNKFPRHSVRVCRHRIVGEGQTVHLEKEPLAAAAVVIPEEEKPQ